MLGKPCRPWCPNCQCHWAALESQPKRAVRFGTPWSFPRHTEMMDLSHNDIGLKGISAMANRFQKKCLDLAINLGTNDGKFLISGSDCSPGLRKNMKIRKQNTPKSRMQESWCYERKRRDGPQTARCDCDILWLGFPATWSLCHSTLRSLCLLLYESSMGIFLEIRLAVDPFFNLKLQIMSKIAWLGSEKIRQPHSIPPSCLVFNSPRLLPQLRWLDLSMNLGKIVAISRAWCGFNEETALFLVYKHPSERHLQGRSCIFCPGGP